MYLRFLSALGLVFFVLLSSNSVFAQARTWKWYDFPANAGFHNVVSSRDSAGCPSNVGGTAVYPDHAPTGEALCDKEAQRLGINAAYMKWYASPRYNTWSSPGDNKLCKYEGGTMKLVNGNNSGGKWTNIVICKYEPFDCGDRWKYEVERGGAQNLYWELNWTRTNAGRDFATVGSTRFVCKPKICTASTCPDTPPNTRDECFLTDEPGEYRKVNGTLCSCPASKDKVGNNCVVDQCKNIGGTQATVPTTTTRNAAGNCLCKNGGTNPQTCTPPVVPPASVACNDTIDNDTDGLIDLLDPGCTSATDTSEENAALAQCADGIDNDADGKIDFVAPTTTPTIPATYNFTTAFPGVSFVPNPSRGEDMLRFMHAKDSTIPEYPTNPASSDIGWFYYNQNTADRICEILGYDTATMNESYTFSNSSSDRTLSWVGNAWTRREGMGDLAIRRLTCSNPLTSGTVLADPECTSATDNNEAPDTVAQCSDGIDNDGDGKIDFSGVNPDPDCSSATDNTESGDLVCPVGTTKTPTPASPVCFLTATPRTSPAGTSFSLTGYSHLTGSCRIADTTTHLAPNTPILPTSGSSSLAVSPIALTINATTTGSITGASLAQVAGLLTCPQGSAAATCSIGAGGVISCGCYNPGVTPPTTTTTSTTPTIPATYNFKTPFPGISYTPPGGDPGYDIMNIVKGKDPSVPPSPTQPTIANLFSYTQETADKACQLMGYQTAVMSSPYAYRHSHHQVTVWENNSWVLKGGRGPGMKGLTCSNPLPGAPIITTTSIVTPPTYTCVSDLCAEGQYFCSAENKCKPAEQPCSTITCNNNATCEAGESCNCADCTTGTLENTKDKCGLGLEGEQLYCTKDSVISDNTAFPFCFPVCLDGQACATTCNQQVGACCPVDTTWNSTENSCVPMTCGKGQFYCAAQKKCLPGGTTCEPGTPVTCVNDGTCSGDESCQCADCVNGGLDDKDKCSIIGGIQAMCSDDNLADGKPGACCVPPEKWDSTANGGAGACTACSNTQAPAELKANYDQPYITCTGNGVVADTHFRYMIKQGSTIVSTSDIFPNSTQILHPKMAAGTYTVQCFYGNATAVNTTGAAMPHTCEKTMTVKTDNENAVQGCNRVYAYKGTTLSDELTSNASFDASFRCGARLTSIDSANPFALYIGAIAPQFLIADTFMTSFLAEYQIGAISTQTQNHRFNTGSTPVSCAVRVGGGYSTNDYCRATACVGDNCNVPQAFSVVHSGDKVCTTAQTDTYNIGCNPDAPEDIRTQCVEMFGAAVTNAGAGAANGSIFRLSFSFNGTPREIECRKYAANDPKLHNIYDNVACTALLDNGEYYDIYAADSNGNKINSLQTTARTVERDNITPVLDPIKYYTDSSLTREVTPATWSNTPVTAVAICRDTPTTESASCSCALLVDDSTTQNDKWNPGIYHGSVDIGADLLRYTRTITESLPAGQSVTVVDTAGNKSTPAQPIQVNLDTDAPRMVVTASSATTPIRDIILTADDSLSKIWKATLAPTTPAATNTQGIIWRKGSKIDLQNLTFNEECGITSAGNFANVAETGAASFPTTATVTIPAVNTATEVVTYCIRDNAGNTTRGIYPVVTDACFSATNMSPIPTFGTYRNLMATRLGGSGTANQKYGYSFSENPTNAACFRGILATNIQTLVTNQLTPSTSTTLTSWDTDRALVKNSTTVRNTNGYYYYRYTTSTGNTLNMTTSPNGTGNKSVIVEGGNIHIKENITYSGTGNTLLLIARKNSSGNGGNIIIDPTVTHIDAILIADGGALQSSDASTPGERLTINGRIYSYNTRGGSLQQSATDVINATPPGKIFSASGTLIDAPSLADAQKQDLERFRPSFVGESTCSLSLNYYAYTTANLPLLLQKPAGYQGGNCAF